MELDNNELDNNKVDKLVTVMNAVGGLLPAGSIISAIISNIIPNQRIDRLTKFIQELNKRVNNIELQSLQERFLEPEFIDLFEDSCIQASKSLGEERLKYLVSILVKGISESELKYFRSKRYFSILSELTDQEVIVLGSYAYSDQNFNEKHKKSLRPKRATLASDDSEVEDEIVFDSILTHLSQLGLVVPSYEIDRELKIPKFDMYGCLKIRNYQITDLGKRFINFIELDAQ